MNNPYQILGVKQDASEDQIKRAYRKLAKELHPDVNPGDKIVEQRFKGVTAAYELLSDKEKRGKFDRGEIDAAGAPRYENAFHRAYTRAGDGGFGFNFGGAGGPGGPNVEDLFSGLFGRGRQRGRAGSTRIKGQDVRYTVRVDFISAAKGVKRRIQLYDGKSLDVTIPPGTTDGQALRLKGQGMSGMGGGAAGDAIVEVMVDTHPYFETNGKNVELEVPVTLSEAVLGGKIKVPTIHGAVTLTVPAGANTGTRLRLRGKGIPATGKGAKAGDQFVTLKVALPDEEDEKLVEFVREWSKGRDDNPRKKDGLE